MKIAARKPRASAASIVAALAAACAYAPTSIETAWRDPTFHAAPFGRVAVVAMFDTAAESRTFEQTAAERLETRGIDAVPGYTILGQDRMYEEAEMREALATADVDGILMFRLIAVDERQRYREPTPYLRVPRSVIWGDPY